MAIDYIFQMAAERSVAAVAGDVARLVNGIDVTVPPINPDSLINPGTTVAHGIWIRVMAPTPLPWEDPVLTDLGFNPAIKIVFRLNKSSAIAPQQDFMIRTVAGLLKTCAADAELHFGDGDHTIWLVRQGGNLSLNEQNDLWTNHRQNVIGQPHRRKTFRWTE